MHRSVHCLFVLVCAIFLSANSALAADLSQEEALGHCDGAPPPPTLVTPANGAVTTAITHPPLGLPELAWETIPCAEKYRIQVSASPGFAILLVDKETYARSYVPEFSLTDGPYYWRVQAGVRDVFQIEWGAFSETWNFAKDWTDAGTIRPELLSPEQDAVRSAFLNGDFSWTAVPGAATYRFEIATDSSFSNIIYATRTSSLATTPVIRPANNVYFWRVIPEDYRDNLGVPSSTRQFTFSWSTAPTQLAPENNVDVAFVPRFQWTAVEAAAKYNLQVSTQPDFGSRVLDIATANTDFTPFQAFANDQDYFWRVRAVDEEDSVSPWSSSRTFSTKWNFAPKLLTPANNSIGLAYPFLSWESVPGAERYQVQIDDSKSFEGILIADEHVYNANTYTHGDWGTAATDYDFYWRVRAKDAQDNATPWSEAADLRSFRTSRTARPTYIYPLFYYQPDVANLPVHDDRTIGWPVFLWDTAHETVAVNGLDMVFAPDYYHLQVDDDRAFGSPNFDIQTGGLAAAPTIQQPFSDLQDNTIYYWRVQAYRGGVRIGGEAVWTTRYHTQARDLPPADGPVPLYPADGFECVVAPPVLGWLPVNGAHHYEVQVATTPDFSSIAEAADAIGPYYVPWQSKLEQMPFGTYWWRFRAKNAADQSIGGWSAARHFNLSIDLANGNPYDLNPPPSPASLLTTSPGYLPEITYVADSPGSGTGDYNLGKFHVMLDRTYTPNYNWVMAFEVQPAPSQSVHYAIYVDVDHREGSGGNSDPTGRPISVDSMYLPEYALYVERSSVDISGDNVRYYRWVDGAWQPPQLLQTDLGGVAWYAPDTSALQILIPYTALESSPTPFSGSLALTVLSLDTNTGNGYKDSIPLQNGTVTSPAFVSDMLTPLYPFDAPIGQEGLMLYDMPTVRWRTPHFDSIDGYQVQVAKDASFTEAVETWETSESRTHPFFELMPAAFQSANAKEDNETYYWRVRIRHERYTLNPGFYDYGPWSPPMRFVLDSRQVANARLSTGNSAFMTPTFLWDRVEGAAGYTIQIDDDANFSSPLVNQKIDATSFTPLEVGFGVGALNHGTQYYWRAAMRRSDNVIGHWTPPMSFIKTSIWPSPIAPLSGESIIGQPTLQWSAVLTPSIEPRLAAPAYRVQVDDDPNFGSPRINAVIQATSYTPRELSNLSDGTWHWRVALVDANGRDGPYSPTQTFAKQYPLPAVLSPVQGTNPGGIPTLSWTPVQGAAYYKVELAGNPQFSGAIVAYTDAASYTPTRDLGTGPFFWRVQMFDAERIPGPIVASDFALGYPTHMPMLWRE